MAPEAKVLARDQVVAALRQGGYGPRELVVRINALATPWGRDDVTAAAASGAHAVLVPKLQSREDVLAVVAALQDAGAPPDLPVWAMVETPLAFLRLDAMSERIRACGCWSPGPRTSSRISMAGTHRRAPRRWSRCRWRCSPRAPTASARSTACISISTTTPPSAPPASRGAAWASTARR